MKKESFKKKMRRHFQDVLEIKTSPHSIAMGFAVGTTLAILPTFGFGIIIGLLFILIFPKISKISMLAAFAIWNPFVLIALYPFEYWIGNLFFSESPIIRYEVEFLNQLFTYSRRLLIGSIILSLVSSIASYFAVKSFVASRRKKRELSDQKP